MPLFKAEREDTESIAVRCSPAACLLASTSQGAFCPFQSPAKMHVHKKNARNVAPCLP